MHDVIDIDDDDDVVSNDLVIIAEKVGKRDKGKTIEAVHEGYSDHRAMVCIKCYFLQYIDIISIPTC